MPRERIITPPPIAFGREILRLLRKRSSWRKFSSKPLHPEEVSMLAWASKRRAIPSYPLGVFVIVGEKSVEGLCEGLYYYNFQEHNLIKREGRDLRKQLARTCLKQKFIEQSSVSIIISVEFPRTTNFYGRRGHNVM